MTIEAKPVAPHLVPSEFYNQLAKAGVIPIGKLRGIPMAERLGHFCQCRHDRAAHDEAGICQAKACRKWPGSCSGYGEDGSRKVSGSPGMGVMRRIPVRIVPKEEA